MKELQERVLNLSQRHELIVQQFDSEKKRSRAQEKAMLGAVADLLKEMRQELGGETNNAAMAIVADVEASRKSMQSMASLSADLAYAELENYSYCISRGA